MTNLTRPTPQPILKNLLLHHDNADASMDQHHTGQKEIILDSSIKDNSSLLELKTSHWSKLPSITTQKHIDLQELLANKMDTQTTFLHPSQGLFPSHMNSTILSVITPILALPSSMKSSDFTEPTFCTSLQHQLLAQTTEGK